MSADFDNIFEILDGCSRLKDAMRNALDKRFGKGADADRDFGHDANFGPCVRTVREYMLDEDGLSALEKALGDSPAAGDIMSGLRCDYAKEWAGALLDSFNPEDCFTDASFIERVAGFYARGDYLGAKKCGENWLDIENGPLAPEAKREIMSEADTSLRVVVAMRASGQGVFIDIRAGDQWHTADGIVGKPDNTADAVKMAGKLAGQKKPAHVQRM